MYVNRIRIRGIGPIKQFSLDLPIRQENPLPIVFVGSNGSGKTNLLSIIGDALFESAAQFFQDVVPAFHGQSRPWFRVVGASTISLGVTGSYALVELYQEQEKYFYSQKAGTITANDVVSLPDDLKGLIPLDTNGNTKSVTMEKTTAEKIFNTGVHVFFPASRAEIPDWVNTDSLPVDEFDLQQRFSSNLQKPIYVEQGLVSLKQWLMALMLDSRVDIASTNELPEEERIPKIQERVNIAHYSFLKLAQFNQIIKIILDDGTAEIGWAGRLNAARVNVHQNGTVSIPSLSSLSTGQSTLINIFGTILRYADLGGQWMANAKGVCVIDEIDAHMHIDLQYRALPKLIKLFPKIQFLMSSHSPLFALGMAKEFGNEDVLIVDLPSGIPIGAEVYSEFRQALEAVRDTVAFTETMIASIKDSNKFLVLLEGETDPLYFRSAVASLEFAALQDVEFQWIGATDESGNGFFTGKNALDQAKQMIRSKPEIVNRKVLLLYDNDANKADENFGDLWIRSVRTNDANTVITKGIENLLPADAFTDEMYDEKKKDAGNGTTTSIRTLNKMRLCESFCANRKDAADFEGFKSVLEVIAALCKPEYSIEDSAAGNQISAPN